MREVKKISPTLNAVHYICAVNYRMGITERKEREKMEMREKILAAATAMFIEEGYDKTSLRHIAEKIEYSPATIYLYFKDKDELFFSIHQMGFTILREKMEALGSIEDPFIQLQRLGEIYIDFALSNPEYYDLMFIMRAPMKAIKELKIEAGCWVEGQSTFFLLQHIVEKAMKAGALKMNDPLQTAMLLWSAVHGMVSLYIRDRFLILEKGEVELRSMMMESLHTTVRMLAP